MELIRIVATAEGYVVCPRRGEIDVEWCLGCPLRRGVFQDGSRMGIVCQPGTHHRAAPVPGPLRDVPPAGVS